MPTPAQAPPQEAQEETAFQRFAKVAQVRIHSFSLTVVTNFFPFVANTIGLPILPSRYDKALLFSTCNVPEVTHSWQILWRWWQDYHSRAVEPKRCWSMAIASHSCASRMASWIGARYARASLNFASRKHVRGTDTPQERGWRTAAICMEEYHLWRLYRYSSC